MVWGFLPNKLKKKSCKIPAHDLEKQTPPRKQCCPKQEWGGRTLAGVGIHFLKDCSIKKTKAVRKWEATAEQELRPAGTRGSRLVAPHQSRRSGGKAEDPQATATDPASAPWGPRVMRMQWPPTPSPGARLARLGGPVLTRVSSTCWLSHREQ